MRRIFATLAVVGALLFGAGSAWAKMAWEKDEWEGYSDLKKCYFSYVLTGLGEWEGPPIFKKNGPGPPHFPKGSYFGALGPKRDPNYEKTHINYPSQIWAPKFGPKGSRFRYVQVLYLMVAHTTLDMGRGGLAMCGPCTHRNPPPRHLSRVPRRVVLKMSQAD